MTIGPFPDLKTDDLPDSPIEALNKCDSKLFPKISILLRIMSIILVTSCVRFDRYGVYTTVYLDMTSLVL